jgi:flagellar motility protein MotE (MotC chaperone)
MRILVVLAIAAKALVVGAWWRESVAEARSEDAAPAATPAAAGAGEAGIPGDLLARTRGFRDLLEATKQRGLALDHREEALATRERALKALEEALGGGPETLAPAAAPGDPPAKPCAVAVTKIYASMKAEEAAPILEKLDDATAQSIFSCMGERQIGAILAAMNRDRAVALTQILADGF